MRERTLGLFLVLGLTASAAKAQEPAELDLPPWARAERSYAGLTTELFVTSLSFDTERVDVAFEPFLQLALTEHWVLSAAMPMGFGSFRYVGLPPRFPTASSSRSTTASPWGA